MPRAQQQSALKPPLFVIRVHITSRKEQSPCLLYLPLCQLTPFLAGKQTTPPRGNQETDKPACTASEDRQTKHASLGKLCLRHQASTARARRDKCRVDSPRSPASPPAKRNAQPLQAMRMSFVGFDRCELGVGYGVMHDFLRYDCFQRNQHRTQRVCAAEADSCEHTVRQHIARSHEVRVP